MDIQLKPRLEAILRAEVAAGHFPSVEDALEAAILGLAADDELDWVRPYLAEAEDAIARGETRSEAEAYQRLLLPGGAVSSS